LGKKNDTIIDPTIRITKRAKRILNNFTTKFIFSRNFEEFKNMKNYLNTKLTSKNVENENK